jgi:glycosyltransferase involved in cell wall biosynthesis
VTDRRRLRILVGDLSRTGVPVVLCRLLGWAAAHVDVDLDVVAIRGGPLRADVAAVATTLTVLEPEGRRSVADAAGAALAVAGRPDGAARVRSAAWRRRLRRLPPPWKVLVHGAGAWPMLATVDESIPVVAHLHELDVGMDRSIPSAQRPALFRRAEAVMVVSRPVGDLAVRDGAVPERITVVPGVVEDRRPPLGGRERGARPGAPVVAGAGAPGWRKGTDRFVAVAHELSRSDPDARATWVGGRPSGPAVPWAEAPDPVTWHDNVEDPWRLLADAAVFLAPSREDALPLVVLEAMQHRVPVVAAAVGGLPDLLADGRGSLVAGHDLRGLHAAAAAVLRDPGSADEAVDAAAEHVAAHHAVGKVGPRWWSTIERGA